MKGYKVYLIDASVFIEAARRYYAFDIVPSFWPRLVELAADGLVLTVDRVLGEIKESQDALANWMTQDFSHAVVSTVDENVVQAYEDIMRWVFDSNRMFSSHAKNDFASGADPWLIAYAAIHNCCVVTQETHKPEIKRQVPIPNVCLEFDVSYTDTFAMMRQLLVAI